MDLNFRHRRGITSRPGMWDLISKPGNQKIVHYLGEKFTENIRVACCADSDFVENRYLEHLIEDAGDANVTKIESGSKLSKDLNDFFRPKVHVTFHRYGSEGYKGASGWFPNPGSFRQRRSLKKFKKFEKNKLGHDDKIVPPTYTAQIMRHTSPGQVYNPQFPKELDDRDLPHGYVFARYNRTFPESFASQPSDSSSNFSSLNFESRVFSLEVLQDANKSDSTSSTSKKLGFGRSFRIFFPEWVTDHGKRLGRGEDREKALVTLAESGTSLSSESVSEHGNAEGTVTDPEQLLFEA